MLQGPIPNLCLASQKEDGIFLFRQVPNVFIICKKKKKLLALEQGCFRLFKRQMKKEKTSE